MSHFAGFSRPLSLDEKTCFRIFKLSYLSFPAIHGSPPYCFAVLIIFTRAFLRFSMRFCDRPQGLYGHFESEVSDWPPGATRLSRMVFIGDLSPRVQEALRAGVRSCIAAPRARPPPPKPLAQRPPATRYSGGGGGGGGAFASRLGSVKFGGGGGDDLFL